MKAIILAAGRGSRLGNLTDDCPKCLVPVAGTPLLQRQLNALREAGISEIGIVRGYLAGRINLPGLHTFDNPRWHETNMVMSLVCAHEWMSSTTCVVSYSDIVYGPSAVQSLLTTPGDIAITFDPRWRELWEARFENPLEDAETFRINDRGILLEIGARAQQIEDIQGQFMGLLKFSPPGWNAVESFLKAFPPQCRDRLDMTSMLSGLIASGFEIHTTPISEPWFELDNERDLVVCESYLSNLPRLADNRLLF
ncbi:MAG: phosphocholine cytidylyltransferase family protein [Verrucomicrobia bacterium]|nr:phosphocholine cytidylyltransferase family protein [Verrucomicrobiota bacterium]